jgi:hypothetical protein
MEDDSLILVDRAYGIRLTDRSMREQGLSAHLFYAGAKYERNGKIVDNFDNVRAAAAPILGGGIEFACTGKSSRVSG